jgi:hypothetical protein
MGGANQAIVGNSVRASLHPTSLRSGNEMKEDQQDSLALLSLPINVQLKLTEGACPTCELINDFTFAWEKEIKEKENLSATIQRIQEIDRIMGEFEEYEYECFEPKALESERWKQIRQLASSLIKELNLRIEKVTDWNDLSPTTKQRDFITLKPEPTDRGNG